MKNNPKFSFASVIEALHACYRVAPSEQPRFSSRIVFLQRCGLFGEGARPGRGKHLNYGPNELHRLVLACELTGLAASPQLILRIVENYWPRLSEIFDRAETAAMNAASDGDVVLVFAAPDWWFDHQPIDIRDCRLGDLPECLRVLQDDEPPPRVFLVNLSRQLRRFHHCLADVHLQFPQPPAEPIDPALLAPPPTMARRKKGAA